MGKNKLKGQVILIDSEYANTVAKGLTDYVTRKIGRTLPQVDLAEWLVCIALDSGMKKEDTPIHAVFVHPHGKSSMDGFLPSSLAEEIDGQAFQDDALGEICLFAVSDEGMNGGAPLMEECIRATVTDKEVTKVALVCPDGTCAKVLKDADSETVTSKVMQISMDPATTEGMQYMSIGYSILHSVGVKPEELS